MHYLYWMQTFWSSVCYVHVEYDDDDDDDDDVCLFSL